MLIFGFRSFWRRKNRDSFRHFDMLGPTKTMTYIHLAIGVRVNRLNGGASRPMPKYVQSHQTEYKLHLNELRCNALCSFALYPGKVACPKPLFKCANQLWFTSKNEMI